MIFFITTLRCRQSIGMTLSVSDLTPSGEYHSDLFAGLLTPFRCQPNRAGRIMHCGHDKPFTRFCQAQICGRILSSLSDWATLPPRRLTKIWFFAIIRGNLEICLLTRPFFQAVNTKFERFKTLIFLFDFPRKAPSRASFPRLSSPSKNPFSVFRQSEISHFLCGFIMPHPEERRKT